MVASVFLYLLVLRVLCVVSMPTYRDTRTEGYGFEAHVDPTSSDDGIMTDEMVEPDSTLEESEVAKYLRDYGFIPQTFSGEGGPDTAEANLTDAILEFQEFFQLPSTGEVDSQVLEMMLLPRCGSPDVLSFSVAWFRWYDLSLTYRIEEFHDNMSIDHQTIRDVIRDAMQIWMDVTALSICEVNDPDVEVGIHIRHVEDDHGDGISFDGPGGILGHAFLPMSGEVHFDATENWTIGMADGIDYLQVAVHEIGHALGLLHSGVEGAIMYPFYRFRPNVELHEDDIRGMQLMYGTPDDLPEAVRYNRCPNTEPESTQSTERTSAYQSTTDMTEEITSTHPSTGIGGLETTDSGVTTPPATLATSEIAATTTVITNLETLAATTTAASTSPTLIPEVTTPPAPRTTSDASTTIPATTNLNTLSTISTSSATTATSTTLNLDFSTPAYTRASQSVSSSPANTLATTTTSKVSGEATTPTPRTTSDMSTESSVTTSSVTVTSVTSTLSSSTHLSSSDLVSSLFPLLTTSQPTSSSSKSLSSSSTTPAPSTSIVLSTIVRDFFSSISSSSLPPSSPSSPSLSSLLTSSSSSSSSSPPPPTSSSSSALPKSTPSSSSSSPSSSSSSSSSTPSSSSPLSSSSSSSSLPSSSPISSSSSPSSTSSSSSPPPSSSSSTPSSSLPPSPSPSVEETTPETNPSPSSEASTEIKPVVKSTQSLPSPKSKTVMSSKTDDIHAEPFVLDKNSLENIGDENTLNSGSKHHYLTMWSLLLIVFHLV